MQLLLKHNTFLCQVSGYALLLNSISHPETRLLKINICKPYDNKKSNMNSNDSVMQKKKKAKLIKRKKGKNSTSNFLTFYNPLAWNKLFANNAFKKLIVPS